MPSTVLFVHGLRTSATMWRAQLESLERAGVAAIAIDLPGHGTRLGERFELDAALAAIDDAAAALDGPLLLCGLSLGGYLALHYAAGIGRQRIDGVIAAACGTSPVGLRLQSYAALAAVIGRLPDRGARLNQLMVDTFIPAAGRDDVVRGGVALDVMADSLDAVSRVDPLRSIAALRVPLLLVNGRFDHFRLEERAYLAAARSREGIPPEWSQLVVVPGASHMVSLSRPDEFTALILAAALAATPAAW